jgi:osmotically-inducible protein OsmY
MANRREDQRDERWVDDPYRSGEWESRAERDRGQYYGQENFRDERRFQDRGLRRQGYEEPGWQQFRGEDRERYSRGPGGGQFRYEQEPGRQSGWGGGQGWQEREHELPPENRHYIQGSPDYGERFRDRPYASSPSYIGHGGYAGHIDPYREGRDRGYGASSTGAHWGSGDVGTHRLGSLTESAAASATRFAGAYGSQDQGSYNERYPQRMNYAGRGPKGYKRSDERIREEVCERLTQHPDIDASNVDINVSNGVVTLSGTVNDRSEKRIAEDIAEGVHGAHDVQNQIRVERFGQEINTTRNTQETTSATANTGAQRASVVSSGSK